ncbi:MAG TPA: hypothetical protein VE619_02050 [Nitrososphaeraceae archaeon]|nr:hypothetical protein [Nitrososphaeraceae archaeon]
MDNLVITGSLLGTIRFSSSVPYRFGEIDLNREEKMGTNKAIQSNKYLSLQFITINNILFL